MAYFIRRLCTYFIIFSIDYALIDLMLLLCIPPVACPCLVSLCSCPHALSIVRVDAPTILFPNLTLCVVDIFIVSIIVLRVDLCLIKCQICIDAI